MTTERLADPSVQTYLASREVVVLAGVGPDGGPWATPMWFLSAPDALFMISVDGLPKVRRLQRDPRVAVVAETTTPEGAIQGVVIRGRAEFLPDSDERRWAVAGLLEKYEPRLERLWRSRVMPGNRVLFRIAPERVRSWGLG
jgi:PPOX class probable F420-dependent enzyme